MQEREESAGALSPAGVVVASASFDIARRCRLRPNRRMLIRLQRPAGCATAKEYRRQTRRRELSRWSHVQSAMLIRRRPAGGTYSCLRFMREVRFVSPSR